MSLILQVSRTEPHKNTHRTDWSSIVMEHVECRYGRQSDGGLRWADMLRTFASSVLRKYTNTIPSAKTVHYSSNL